VAPGRLDAECAEPEVALDPLASRRAAWVLAFMVALTVLGIAGTDIAQGKLGF
jgi:hypothetical protein